MQNKNQINPVFPRETKPSLMFSYLQGKVFFLYTQWKPKYRDRVCEAYGNKFFYLKWYFETAIDKD